MVPKIVILRGLPCSGKSTYARNICNHEAWKRINKDDLRAMVDDHHFGDKFNKNDEKMIVEARNALMQVFMFHGRNVIIDDTNFAPIHEQRIRELVTEWNAQVKADPCMKEGPYKIYDVEVKFFDIDPEVAIQRDLRRTHSVGAKVIWDMYNKHLRPKIPAIIYDSNLPNAIIVDVDGTLAHMTNRGPYDPTKYGDDAFDEIIANIVHAEREKGTHIIVCSGRDEDYRSDTEAWLSKHGFEFNDLHMRPSGNRENDAKIKREIYENNIRDKYNIKFVLDDRDRVVRMWREQGLICLQVAAGNF